MTKTRRRAAAGLAALALCATSVVVPASVADSIKTCSGPHSQFTYTQQGSCNSSHTETATNPGGNPPPGQQP